MKNLTLNYWPGALYEIPAWRDVQADAITGFMHKSGEHRQAHFAAAKIRGSYATASQVCKRDGNENEEHCNDLSAASMHLGWASHDYVA